MATKAIDLLVNVTPQGIDSFIQKMNDLKSSTNLDDNMKLQIDKIISRLATMKTKLNQQVQLDKLDPSKLGFQEIENLIYGLMSKISNSMGQTFSPSVLQPFRDALNKAQSEEGKNAKEILAIQEEINKKRAEVKKTPEATKVKYKDPVVAEQKRAEWADKLQKSMEKANRVQPTTGEEKDLAAKIQNYDDYLAKVKLTEAEVAKLIEKEKELLKLSPGLKKKVDKAQAKLTEEEAKIPAAPPEEPKEIQVLNQALKQNAENRVEVTGAATEQTKQQTVLNQKIREEKDANEKAANSLTTKIAKYFSFSFIIQQVRKLINMTINSLRELDKAMTEAAIVTNMNRQEAWKLLGAYQNLAKKTGLATSEISNIVVEFLKQGRTVKEAMELAEVAAKSARVAGISAKDAVDYLTSAVNGFGLAADQAISIADKFAAISASSATDFEELAIAMSKVAPSAKSAGIGVDFMMGVIAKGLETTREAPENIGTAFKTIFARMREVTDLGKATEDGMSLNRVEKSLQSVGVSLRDSSGQFRNLETVLTEVGDKWNTLNSIEQAYLATALAGTRQQPRLLAVFNDFARTKELIKESADASGQLAFQHMEYMDGLEAATANMKTAWEGVVTAFTTSEPIIQVINLITNGLNGITKFIESLSGNHGFGSTIISWTILLITLAAVLFINRVALGNLATGILDFGKGIITLIPNIIKWIATEWAATAANGALSASILAVLWPLLAVVAAVVILVGLFWFFTEALKTNEERISENATQIQKLNKEMDEMKNKADNVKTLTDRFDELNKKVNKTTEELDEMNSIMGELETVEIGDQTFNIGYTDFAGNKAVNQAEIDRMNDYVEQQTAEKEKERLAELRDSFAIDAAKAFDNPIIADTARGLGYEIGANFIEGTSDGIELNAEDAKIATEKLAKSLAQVDMKNFVGMKYKVGKEVFDTKEEAEAYVAANPFRMDTATTYNGIEYTAKVTNKVEELGVGFQEDSFKKFSTNMASIYKEYVNNTVLGNQEILNEQKRQEDNNIEDLAKLREMALENTLENYSKGLEKIEEIYSDPVERKVALETFAATDTDAALLYDLVYNKQIKLEVIAPSGVAKTAELASELSSTIANTAGNDILTNEEYTGMSQSDKIAYAKSIGGDYFVSSLFRSGEAAVDSYFQGIISRQQTDADDAAAGLINAFSTAVDKTDITGGFESARRYMIDTLKIDPTSDEGKTMIASLYDYLDISNSSEIATLMSQNQKTVSKLFGIDKKILEGNFEDLAELGAEFGVESIKNYLAGDAAAFNDILNDQRDEQIQNIDDSIERLLASVSNDETQLSDALKNELETLRLMKVYYEDIVGLEQQREAALSNIEDLNKKVTDLQKIQTNLSNLGFFSDKLDIFKNLEDTTTEQIFDNFNAQLKVENDNLLKFGEVVNGVFVPNPDRLDEAKLAIDGYQDYILEYTKFLNDEYEKQKKDIEDRYKTEVDAIKSANDEKWKEIEYNTELMDIQDKLIEAKRKISALTLDTTSGVDLKQAQKDLQSLKQERQKAIEQNILDQIDKELQVKRDEDLLAAQTSLIKNTGDLNTSINTLGTAITSLTLALNDNTGATEENTDTVVEPTIGAGRVPTKRQLEEFSFQNEVIIG